MGSMRFLLECVGCCMMSAAPGEASPEEPSSPATPRGEETRSLVTPVPATTSSRLGRRRKRTSSASEWKPSLFAISEDITVPNGPEKKDNRNRPAQVAVKPASSRNVKRCAASSVRVNAHSRSHDFGHNALPMVVPVFSAAPFMF